MYRKWVKRLLDILLSGAALVVLCIPMGVIALWIKLDSPGPVLFRQKRVGKNKVLFDILKFRTMRTDTPHDMPTHMLKNPDAFITKSGHFLRKTSLDELPQLLDVLAGDMSFVGTRPEATKYVAAYKPEYYATLLLPAGITSEASIRYKDEAKLLDAAEDVDRVYMEKVLPGKMKYNLDAIRNFSLRTELGTMFRTVAVVLDRGE